MPNEVIAYVVFFNYRSMPSKSVFIDRCAAEGYAAKWHGTVFPLVLATAPVDEMIVVATNTTYTPDHTENDE